MHMLKFRDASPGLELDGEVEEAIFYTNEMGQYKSKPQASSDGECSEKHSGITCFQCNAIQVFKTIQDKSDWLPKAKSKSVTIQSGSVSESIKT